MRLIDVINEASTVMSLQPEELAAAMLRHMNWLLQHDYDHKPNQFHANNYCNGEAECYRQRGQANCSRELAEAWGYLIATGMLAVDPSQRNGWCFLTRRARQIQSDQDYEHYKQAGLYPTGSIHPVIESETHAEFLRGDYETAVFKAFKAVEVATRQDAGAPPNLIGVELMTYAFNPKGSPLRNAAELPAEQESLMALFRGAIGRFKNPASHREVDYQQPVEVVEILQLASLLMRILDRRQPSAAAPGV